MKVYDNKQVAGTKSVRASRVGKPVERADFSSSINALKVKENIARTQAENDGKTEYLKWTEAAAAKEVELTQKNGSNAVKLQEDFDNWNADYYNKMQFNDRDAENAFLSRTNVDTVQHRKRINKYEASEAFEYNQQLNTQETSKAYSDAYVALESGDQVAYQTNIAKGNASANALFSGAGDAETKIQDVKSKMLYQIASTKVSSGDAVSAATMVERAAKNGDIKEMDKQTFMLMNKKAISTNKAEDIVDATIASYGETYTKGEWADKNGIKIPESERTQDSGKRKNQMELMEQAAKDLKNYNYKSDEFFVGDKDYNDYTNEEIQRYFSKIKEQQEKAHKSSAGAAEKGLYNKIYAYKMNQDGSGKDYDEIRAEIVNFANVSGEGKKSIALQNALDKETKTDPDAYLKIQQAVISGNGMVSDYDIMNMAAGKTSVKDMKSIMALGKNSRDDNWKAANQSGDLRVRASLDIDADTKVEEMSPTQRKQYQSASRTMNAFLMSTYDGNAVPEESVTKAVEQAIASSKIDYDVIKKDPEQLEETLFDPNNKDIKDVRKEFEYSTTEFVPIIRRAVDYGVTNPEGLKEYIKTVELFDQDAYTYSTKVQENNLPMGSSRIDIALEKSYALDTFEFDLASRAVAGPSTSTAPAQFTLDQDRKYESEENKKRRILDEARKDLGPVIGSFLK